ncbi:uncharacterized protein V6R79_024551 [Siganus canaliculatus]
MMRLLFLCLLLLPAATVLSKEIEGSADGDVDDEDLSEVDVPEISVGSATGTMADKTKAEQEPSDQFTLIVVVVAVTALTLSIAAIVTILLVRRHLHNRQQGIYSVPTEQDHKGV